MVPTVFNIFHLSCCNAAMKSFKVTLHNKYYTTTMEQRLENLTKQIVKIPRIQTKYILSIIEHIYECFCKYIDYNKTGVLFNKC